MKTDPYKLLIALAAAFILPAITYIIGASWNNIVGRALHVNPDSKINRLWTTCCLLSPIIFIGMIVKFGFETLRAVWLNSPYLSSIIFILVGIVVPIGIIGIVVNLWSPYFKRRSKL